MYKIEEYTQDCDISFKYILTTDDKKKMSDVIHQVLNGYDSPKETKPIVEAFIPQIQHIYDELDIFFKKNPGKYFVRLSTCSPKDAWYSLGDGCENYEEEPMTLDTIKRDIEMLKIDNAIECIMVLCHSERIYYEMEFNESEISIILTPWKNDILYDTETRCFIRNRQLIGFSQYYADIPNGYLSISKITDVIIPNTIYNYAVEFINKLLLSNKIPYENAVVDIAISESAIQDNVLNLDKFIFIEINPFNRGTDSPFFEWDYLLETDMEAIKNINFKFHSNGISVTFNNSI